MPLSYITILDLINGRRTVGAVKDFLYVNLNLPKDIIDRQVFLIFKDLAVLGAISLKRQAGRPAARRRGKAASEAWALFRRGEAALKQGDCPAADAALTQALNSGMPGAWVYALRGEARRHLGKLAESLADLDEAARLCAAQRATPKGAERMRGLWEEFNAKIERSWIEDRILIFRGKLRLLLGDNSGAREDADAALRINPRQSEALVVRARAAVAQGELELAMEDLKNAKAIESSGQKGQG